MDLIVRRDIIEFFAALIRHPKSQCIYLNYWNTADIRYYLGGDCLDITVNPVFLRHGHFGSIFGIPLVALTNIPRGFYAVEEVSEDRSGFYYRSVNNVYDDLELKPIGKYCKICEYQDWGPMNRHTQADCDLRVANWIMNI